MIKLDNTKVEKDEDGYSLSLGIEQIQAEDAYLMQIPVAVTMEGEERAWQTIVKMDKKRIDTALSSAFKAGKGRSRS